MVFHEAHAHAVPVNRAHIAILKIIFRPNEEPLSPRLTYILSSLRPKILASFPAKSAVNAVVVLRRISIRRAKS